MTNETENLQDWQLRVVEEHSQLQEKTTKLGAFFASNATASIEMTDFRLLAAQHNCMKAYLNILEMRIANWVKQ